MVVVNTTGGREVPPLLRREEGLIEELFSFMWVWDDWRDAVIGRPHPQGEHQQLNHQMLYYWQFNRQTRADPWEISVLLALDAKYLSELLVPLDDKKEPENG